MFGGLDTPQASFILWQSKLVCARVSNSHPQPSYLIRERKEAQYLLKECTVQRNLIERKWLNKVSEQTKYPSKDKQKYHYHDKRFEYIVKSTKTVFAVHRSLPRNDFLSQVDDAFQSKSFNDAKRRDPSDHKQVTSPIRGGYFVCKREKKK